MTAKWFALAVCTAACGSVAREPPTADAPIPVDAAVDARSDAPPPPLPRMYRGTLAMTPAVAFGGMGFCNYTITLRQISLDLGILPNGQVTSGQAQALNVEAAVPPCPHPPIAPAIATYTYVLSTPITGGLQLAFMGAPANFPRVNLVVDLTSVGAAFQARMGFKRVDQSAPFDWSVVTMPIALSPQ